MADRINRQKLFIEFLQNKYLVKMGAIYNSDSMTDIKAQENFYLPDDKLYYFDFITDGYVSYSKDKNGYHFSYASMYYGDLQLNPNPVMTVKDTFLLELCRDVKKQVQYFRENEVYKGLICIAYKLINDDELIKRFWLDNRFNWNNELDNFTDYKESFLKQYNYDFDIEKYRKIFESISVPEMVKMFYKIYDISAFYNYDYYLTEYLPAKQLKEKEQIQDSNIITFPVTKNDINSNYDLNSILDYLFNEPIKEQIQEVITETIAYPAISKATKNQIRLNKVARRYGNRVRQGKPTVRYY